MARVKEGQPAGAAPANAHAPRVGSFKRILGPLHYSGSFWLRFHYWLATETPEWFLRFVSWLCVRVCYVTLPSVRHALAKNHALVQGAASRRETRRRVLRALDEFCWCLTERWERFEGKHEFDVRVEGLDHWLSIKDSESGVLFVTAHVGMWESASRVAAEKNFTEVHLVREREMDAGAQEFLEGLLARDEGTTYVTHFADNPTLGILLMNAIREGHLVALQGDRPRAGGRTLTTTLFGQPFSVPEGPAILTRSTGCPMLPVFALREGRRRYLLRFCEPLIAQRTRDRTADNQALVDAFAHSLEDVIRSAPEQWFKFGG